MDLQEILKRKKQKSNPLNLWSEENDQEKILQIQEKEERYRGLVMERMKIINKMERKEIELKEEKEMLRIEKEKERKKMEEKEKEEMRLEENLLKIKKDNEKIKKQLKNQRKNRNKRIVQKENQKIQELIKGDKRQYCVIKDTKPKIDQEGDALQKGQIKSHTIRKRKIKLQKKKQIGREEKEIKRKNSRFKKTKSQILQQLKKIRNKRNNKKRKKNKIIIIIITTTKEKMKPLIQENGRLQQKNMKSSQLIDKVLNTQREQDRYQMNVVIKEGAKRLSSIMQDIYLEVKSYSVTKTNQRVADTQASTYLDFLKRRKLQEPQIVKTDEVYQKWMEAMEELNKLPLTMITIITDKQLIQKVGFNQQITEEELDGIFDKNAWRWDVDEIRKGQSFEALKQKKQDQEDEKADHFDYIQQVALPLVWALTGLPKHVYKGQDWQKEAKELGDLRVPLASQNFFEEFQKAFDRYGEQRLPEEVDSMNKRKEMTRAWEKGITAYRNSPIMKKETYQKIWEQIQQRNSSDQEEIKNVIETVIQQIILEEAREKALVDVSNQNMIINKEVIISTQLEKLEKQRMLLVKVFTQWTTMGLLRQVSNRQDQKNFIAAISLSLEVVDNYLQGTVTMLDQLTMTLNEYIYPVSVINFQNEPQNSVASNFLAYLVLSEGFFNAELKDPQFQTEGQRKNTGANGK